VSIDQHTEIDEGKLMQFVFRAVGEVGAALNAALVVMGRMNLALGSVGAICVALLGYMLASANISLPLTLLVVAAAGVIASVIMGLVELRSGLDGLGARQGARTKEHGSAVLRGRCRCTG